MAVVTLPSTPSPRSITMRPLDFGVTQRPSTGGPATRIIRAGTRWAADIEYPPMAVATAQPIFARIARAMDSGLQLVVPLAWSQSGAGTPNVNGSSSAGTSLLIKSATPGYQVREGFWITVENGTDIFLHQVAADATISVGGTATLSVWPPLRSAFVNGNGVELVQPFLWGWIVNPPEWPLPHNRIVQLSFSVEEMA